MTGVSRARGAAPLRPWPFLLLFVMPLSVAWFASRGDLSWIALWVLALAILPLADAILPLDRRSPPPDAPLRESRRSAFTWIILAYVPVQLAVTAYTLCVASTGAMDWWERIGLVATLGLANGAVGFTLAHELIHRASRIEFAAGQALLLGLAYPHYSVEHVRTHHRHVGTPKDPAFARFGESFHLFWPRSVIGQAISAWKVEAERLGKIGKPAWSADNFLLRQGILQIALLAGLTWWLGPLGLGLFLLQVLTAVVLLEAANYCEHYGLARREIAPGRYEPQTPRHSWDAYGRISNYFIIELGRHSDHHAQPGRPYQFLRTHDDSPQLPASLAAMVTLAMIPPLWFRIMNPRVKAAQNRVEPALPGAGATA
jgi:alkane 1-monooxygenase